KVVPTAAAAAALGVHTGTDLDCGNEYASLIDAVHQGLITEQQIDTSLIRLFVARFRLGMFDPPEQVKWARIPITALDDSSHRVLARQVARESMVLLKNAGHLLPLRRDFGTIAVIGPNADQWRMLLGNYNGIPADPVTPLRGIRVALVGTVKFQLYLDDNLVVQSVYPTHDGEFPDPRFSQTEPLLLQGGRRYRLRVDGEESYGEAELQLLWATPTEALEAEAVQV